MVRVLTVFLNNDLEEKFHSVNHISRIFMKLFLIHVMLLSRFLHFPNFTPTLKFLKEDFIHNTTKNSPSEQFLK